MTPAGISAAAWWELQAAAAKLGTAGLISEIQEALRDAETPDEDENEGTDG